MGQLLLPILIAILPVTVLVMAAAGRTTQALTARNKKEEAFCTLPPHPVPAPFRRPFPIPPQLSLENTMKIDYDSL